MRKTIFIGLILLGLATTAVMAQQASEKGSPSPMQGMMQEMMKGEKSTEGKMEGMGGMGMMMKMMEQCSAMMESAHSGQKEPTKADKK
jgi:hypothetical protein